MGESSIFIGGRGATNIWGQSTGQWLATKACGSAGRLIYWSHHLESGVCVGGRGPCSVLAEAPLALTLYPPLIVSKQS